jgi:tRNA(His) 5'-end guanylyltransferase
MKAYEAVPQTYLTRRTPAILRIDGKAFHTFTRGMDKPWDERLELAMHQMTLDLCAHVEGTDLAFWQSDEVSLLLIDYARLNTNPWFEKNVQKMVSVAASQAAFFFARAVQALMPERADSLAVFDARVFVLPREEVTNYFLWRQQDATRNSILGLAQAHYSPKQLHGKDSSEMQEMLWQKGINWNDTPTHRKRGACAVRVVGERSAWTMDLETPRFSEARYYIDRFAYPADEEGGGPPAKPMILAVPTPSTTTTLVTAEEL